MRKEKIQSRANVLDIKLTQEGDCIVLECSDGYRLVGSQVHVWQEVVTYGMTMLYIWDALWQEMKLGVECCPGCPECQE